MRRHVLYSVSRLTFAITAGQKQGQSALFAAESMAVLGAALYMGYLHFVDLPDENEGNDCRRNADNIRGYRYTR